MIFNRAIHRKTLNMNLVGAVGWLMLGAVLVLNGMGEMLYALPVASLFLYALIVSLPAITAYSLISRHTAKLNLFVQAFNYFSIVYFIFSYIQVALEEKTMKLERFDWALLISLLLVVVPAIINIRSLRHLRK